MLLIFTSQSALADSYPANVLGKLTNGVANVTFGVVEIPKTIFITSQSQGPAYGATAGILMGMMQMVGRTLNGVLMWLLSLFLPNHSSPLFIFGMISVQRLLIALIYSCGNL